MPPGSPQTPLTGPALPASVVAGALGTGGSAVLLATTATGDRGRCSVTIGTGAATGGVLATVNFPRSAGGQRAYSTQVIEGAMAVGSLGDPDLRPVVLTAHPALPAGVSLVAVPIFDAPVDRMPQMTGFQIVASAALTLGGAYTFAWAVL